MPVAKVHIAAGKGPERRKAVAQAVIAAMAMAFKIPEDDVIVLMTERGPDEIYNKDENFILIELLALGGRSLDAKRQLYRLLFDNLTHLSPMKPKDMLVMLHDMPKENCGVRGGLMASDVALEFKVNV